MSHDSELLIQIQTSTVQTIDIDLILAKGGLISGNLKRLKMSTSFSLVTGSEARINRAEPIKPIEARQAGLAPFNSPS